VLDGPSARVVDATDADALAGLTANAEGGGLTPQVQPNTCTGQRRGRPDRAASMRACSGPGNGPQMTVPSGTTAPLGMTTMPSRMT
jgi:hypothetical protein